MGFAGRQFDRCSLVVQPPDRQGQRIDDGAVEFTRAGLMVEQRGLIEAAHDQNPIHRLAAALQG